MTRLSLPVIGCMILASAFAGDTYADENLALRKSANHKVLVDKLAYKISDGKRWDVIVFKCASDRNHNYIKRLIGLPGETVVLQDGQLRPATKMFDTIKAKGAKIEITRDAIRIDGGNVEIRRTIFPKSWILKTPSNRQFHRNWLAICYSTSFPSFMFWFSTFTRVGPQAQSNSSDLNDMTPESLPPTFLDDLRELEAAYCRHDDPVCQSGFGGGSQRWREEREPIVDTDGDFLYARRKSRRYGICVDCRVTRGFVNELSGASRFPHSLELVRIHSRYSGGEANLVWMA